jgi:hypothetical protein
LVKKTEGKLGFKGNIFGTCPSRQELKLRAARCSGDPKKIVGALSQLPGVEGVTTQILHLEGEEIFGNTKRKDQQSQKLGEMKSLFTISAHNMY